MLKNKKVMTETVISYHLPNVASSQCDQESLNICSQLLVSERDRATFPITSYRYKLVKNTQLKDLTFNIGRIANVRKFCSETVPFSLFRST